MSALAATEHPVSDYDVRVCQAGVGGGDNGGPGEPLLEGEAEGLRTAGSGMDA